MVGVKDARRFRILWLKSLRRTAGCIVEERRALQGSAPVFDRRLPGYLGFSALLFWASMANETWDARVPSCAFGGVFWVAVSAACLLYAVAALGGGGRCCTGVGPGGNAALTIGMGAAVLLARYGGVDSPVVLGALLVMGAGAAAWELMEWGIALCKLETERLVCVLAIDACVVFMLKAVGVLVGEEGLAPVLRPVLEAALLGFSWVGLVLAKRIPTPTFSAFYTRQNQLGLAGVLLFFALFSIVLKLLDILVPTTAIGPLGGTVAFCVLLVLVVVAVASPSSVDFSASLRMLLLATAGATFVYVATDGFARAGAAGVVFGIRELTRFYLFMLMADIAAHSDRSPVVVFGIGWACSGLPRLPLCFVTPGDLGAVRFGDGGYVTLVLALILLLLLVIMAFSLYTLPAGMRAPLAILDPRSMGPNGGDVTERLGAQLAARYDLTAREAEIAKLICEGRSKVYIADALFISENTVKYHVRNLYRKVGVTSKQELIDRCNQTEV